jgi:transposase
MTINQLLMMQIIYFYNAIKSIDIMFHILLNAYMKNNTSVRMNQQTIAVTKTLFFKHLKNNVSALAIAFMLFLPRSTSYKWQKEYHEKGELALVAKKRGRPTGIGRVLNPKEEEELQRIITDCLPQDYGLNFGAWTRKATSELIQVLFGKSVAERTIGDYMKRWNFTPQKPAKVAYQRDPIKVKEWLESTFKSIKEKAKRLKAKIFFGDEAGIHTEGFNTKSYAPKGKTPVIPTTGSRLKINIISAISNTGILRYMTYGPQSMNCRIFIQFMQNLINSSKGTMVFLVVDNLRVHHGKMVTKWLKEHSNEIQLFFLPPYCPDLNPDEYFNHVLKQRFHSKIQPKDMDEFSGTVGGILRKSQRSPKTIENLFQNKHVQYTSKVE